jgi:hypothetical protein
LHGQSEAIAAKGARLVVVGNGPPVTIAGFRKTTGFTGELFTDPSRASYSAAAFRPGGVLRMLHPCAAVAAVRALLGGFKNGKIEGSAFQLGGVLVVRSSGELAFRYESKFAGDHPSSEAVLAAL